MTTQAPSNRKHDRDAPRDHARRVAILLLRALEARIELRVDGGVEAAEDVDLLLRQRGGGRRPSWRRSQRRLVDAGRAAARLGAVPGVVPRRISAFTLAF